MAKINIHNWAFATIPEIGNRTKFIIALIGNLDDGKFLPGSGRIVDVDTTNNIATSESGTEYILGEPDKTDAQTLLRAVNRYSKK